MKRVEIPTVRDRPREARSINRYERTARQLFFLQRSRRRRKGRIPRVKRFTARGEVGRMRRNVLRKPRHSGGCTTPAWNRRLRCHDEAVLHGSLHLQHFLWCQIRRGEIEQTRERKHARKRKQPDGVWGDIRDWAGMSYKVV